MTAKELRREWKEIQSKPTMKGWIFTMVEKLITEVERLEEELKESEGALEMGRGAIQDYCDEWNTLRDAASELNALLSTRPDLVFPDQPRWENAVRALRAALVQKAEEEAKPETGGLGDA